MGSERQAELERLHTEQTATHERLAEEFEAARAAYGVFGGLSTCPTWHEVEDRHRAREVLNVAQHRYEASLAALADLEAQLGVKA
jgi:hypothetical protein